ncbi:MAG: NUDIX hydrolase [Nanoarchaeota archaeon]|nr:NUDIX hydrolase [Nanoarchaeota archaeon]
MLRSTLPYRNNCEGYFTDNKGNILATITHEGIIIFPGGGIEEKETPEEAIQRETLEETGAHITDLTFLDTINIPWWDTWAKTAKQQERYQHYQGEHMHFFTGRIHSFSEQPNNEDSWKGKKFLTLKEAIHHLQLQLKKEPASEPMIKTQLRFLQKIVNTPEE